MNSLSFDTTMNRDVSSDLSVEDYISYQSSFSLPNEQSTTTTSTIKSKTNNRNKGTRTNAYREWQEFNKWNLLVSSLTMPQLNCPNVIDIYRNSILLTWETSYVPHVADLSRFSFNITTCEYNNNNTEKTKTTTITTSSNSDSDNDKNELFEIKENCLNQEFDKTVFTMKQMSKKPSSNTDKLSILDSMQDDSNTVYIFTANVGGLKPDTSYIYNIIMNYGQSSSSPSVWSQPIVTKPPSVPSAVTGNIPYNHYIFIYSIYIYR